MNKISRLNAAIVGALVVSCFAAQSHATVTGGAITGGGAKSNGGAFLKLTPPIANPIGAPNSVGADTFQNNNLYAFDEGQNIYVPSPVAVDDLFGPLTSGFVPANSVVASHYIFFDPDGLTSVEGTVSFDSDIYGVIYTTSALAASDFLINTGVNYLNPGLRGLEAGQDTVTIINTRTIEIDWTAGTPGDYIRVLTEFSPLAAIQHEALPNPEPVTAMLSCMGLGGLAAATRRRRAC